MYSKKQLPSAYDLTPSELQEAILLYTQEGWGCRRIAERFGRSKGKILKDLRNHGVSIRSSGTTYLAINPKSRFFNYVKKSDSCWDWTASTTDFGHGRFNCNKNKAIYAHRYSWEIHKGDIPLGMQVLHRCDNPKCVNPDHLFLGTQADNMLDMKAKHRGKTNVAAIKGSLNGRSKLDDREVQSLRIRYQLGESPKILFTEVGISKAQFWRIISGKNRPSPTD